MVLEYLVDTWDYRSEILPLLKDKCYKKGEFTLSSGRKTQHYVNCKSITLNGESMCKICPMILEHITPNVKAVGGLTLGADPLVTGVAMMAWGGGKIKLASLIVRKQAKGYGTNSYIEGPQLPEGSEVTVLEDVITTGGSSIIAVERLRDAGYVVNRVISIVDRQEGGEADDNMKEANLELISLFKLEDLIEDKAPVRTLKRPKMMVNYETN